MSAIQLASPETTHSGFDAKAALLGLATSRLLFRRKHDSPRQALDSLIELIATSTLVRAAVIWSEEKGQVADQRHFGSVEDPSDYAVGLHESREALVGVGLAGTASRSEQDLRVLAELLAQQWAQFLSISRLSDENEAARQQLRIEEEALELHKAMTCASALLVRQGPMTHAKATEYLMGASVRTGRPLLQVANSVVLAYQTSRLRFERAARTHRHPYQRAKRKFA